MLGYNYLERGSTAIELQQSARVMANLEVVTGGWNPGTSVWGRIWARRFK